MSEPLTVQENNFRQGRVRLPGEYSRDVGSDGRGFYKFTPLPIGGYKFRVEKKPRKFRITVQFK